MSTFRAVPSLRAGARVLCVGSAVLALTGCASVRQDQVGLRATAGKIGDKPAGPGAKVFIPGFQRVITVPSRTVNREVRLDLPSKEGLNIGAEVSILYRIQIDKAAQILREAGEGYEENVILPVFRSAAADVAARFMAKDMHSGERTVIEKAIKEQMVAVLGARGFIIENVLLKQIRLPAGLAEAVEQKLEAEQRSEQMRFILERERQEAERRRIEAEGVRDAQRIISEGLTPLLLDYQSIQAFRELAASGNAKTIITDGKTPFLINPTEPGAGMAAEVGPRRTIVEPRRVTPAAAPAVPAATTTQRGRP
ncbi:MAG: prohibitin family protein [Gemmatimonadaceae bacterium]|jgi:regulator of protease activity HflC (stomatin/prohibitin superfamily)|nr:prohibitin family protein [Gemmatimonadaceae bacterium]